MSANFFAILDDSDDEETKVTPKAVTKPSSNENSNRNKSTQAGKNQGKKPTSVNNSRSTGKDGNSNRGGGGGGDTQVVDKDDNDRRRQHHYDRNTRSGRGGRGEVRDGKRVFDRRSGTGRGKEIKKDGGGARNWGSDKNDARRAETDNVDEDQQQQEEEPAATEEGSKNAGHGAREKEYKEEEEEKIVVDNTISYEAYMAQKSNSDSVAFVPVKEKELTNEFAGMKMKPVAVEEGYFGGDKKKKSKARKEKKGPELLNIEFGAKQGGYSNDNRRDDNRRDGGGRGGRGGGSGRGGGGGRGGRGGGRGGRGRGGQNSHKQGLNVTDQAAFPSL